MNTPSSIPRFSIAIPTYNRASRFLPEAIAGVLGQSFGDFELIVSDNGSTDGTEAYVRSLDDPRLRYVKQDPAIPAGEHFARVTALSHGEYVVLHQDDDLLHRDFLLRADDALRSHPDASIYACPIWRQQHGHGYKALLLRPQAGHNDQAVTRDEVTLFSGEYAAAQLFDPIRHFLHPTLAMRRADLVAIGGFDPSTDYQSDLVTQARLLFRGSLVYDPRPGGVSRVHPTNFMRGKSRAFRKRFFRSSYVELIRHFEGAGLDWRTPLADYLVSLSDKEVLACLFEWTYYRAPLPLRKLGFAVLRDKYPSAWRYYRQCLTKLGPRNLLRHWFDGRTGAPADTDAPGDRT